MEFKEHLRNVDVLMIDDLRLLLIGKDDARGGKILSIIWLRPQKVRLSADKSPSDLSGLEQSPEDPPGLRHGRRPAHEHVRAPHLDP